jgi:RHS repeat-associated protein
MKPGKPPSGSSIRLMACSVVRRRERLFNGRYGVMLEASGRYYMRARYYHPEIRRFVNQDVLLGNYRFSEK